MNIITIFLGLSVGCTTSAAPSYPRTVLIVILGLLAFCFWYGQRRRSAN